MFIPNWRAAWRMASVWCYLGAMVIVGIWLAMTWITGDAYVVQRSEMALLGALLALGLFCRVLQQPGLAVDVVAQLADDLTGDAEA